ncbi:MAG: hypothetical protein Q8S00_03540 [Deltaproteobacteria bacterium]|nr:hypothetical protein [Deltaproteobacteria bacterium]MDZ4342604.1 hypothetical protein [Candidatus Binatia bacterium]
MNLTKCRIQLRTLEEQYTIKNLVLIAAGLVIGSAVRRGTKETLIHHQKK